MGAYKKLNFNTLHAFFMSFTGFIKAIARNYFCNNQVL